MIENVSTQLTVFHCFAHCLLPRRAFASLYVLLFLEKEAEIGGREGKRLKISFEASAMPYLTLVDLYPHGFNSLHLPKQQHVVGHLK